MSLTMLPRRSSGLIALGVATGLALSSLVSAQPSTAAKPAGSRAEVMLETGDATGDPDNAITAGWWGHEGPAGTGTTYLSLNAANSNGDVNDASIAALLAALGTDDLSKVYYAIVPTTLDGSNEAPTVAEGDNAAETFDWVLAQPFGTGMSGNTNPNDSVTTVSTLTQLTNWVAAGQPVQGFDNNLVLHDVTAPDSPVSTAPLGSSILNTWPAGTKLSLVAYVTAGTDPALNGVVPLVKRGSDGKAQTAWMPFTTVASSTSALRTSAGYSVIGAAKPTLSMSDSFTGDSGSVTATIKKPDGSIATDATGTVSFAPVTNNVVGAPQNAAASNGSATLAVSLAPGGSQVYEVKYTPNTAAAGAYLASDAVRYTVVNETTVNPPAPPTATATALTAVGVGTQTLTATVSAGATGTVAFSDGATSLGQAAVSGGTAKVTATLAAGQHPLKAVFTPSDSTKFAGSTGTATVWVAKVTATVSPKKVLVGKKAKLTVTVEAPGTTAAGPVTVTVTPAKGKAATVSGTVAGGKATVTLPKAVKGKTTITVAYAGSGTVLGGAGTASYNAKPKPKKKK